MKAFLMWLALITLGPSLALAQTETPAASAGHSATAGAPLVPSHAPAGVELHHQLRLGDGPDEAHDVALTLDACGGRFDAELIELLIREQVPATIFVTRKWLDANPAGTAVLLAHPALFDIEDHGLAHVPAIVGAGRKVYGLAGEPDLAHLNQEVGGAAERIQALTGSAPRYYRGAGAVYDAQAMQAIAALGFHIAGFSVNADAGATLPAAEVARRLLAVQPGDVVIAHMNKPAGQTAEGFAAALPELQRRGYRFVTLAQRELVPVETRSALLGRR